MGEYAKLCGKIGPRWEGNETVCVDDDAHVGHHNYIARPDKDAIADLRSQVTRLEGERDGWATAGARLERMLATAEKERDTARRFVAEAGDEMRARWNALNESLAENRTLHAALATAERERNEARAALEMATGDELELRKVIELIDNYIYCDQDNQLAERGKLWDWRLSHRDDPRLDYRAIPGEEPTT